MNNMTNFALAPSAGADDIGRSDELQQLIGELEGDVEQTAQRIERCLQRTALLAQALACHGAGDHLQVLLRAQARPAAEQALAGRRRRARAQGRPWRERGGVGGASKTRRVWRHDTRGAAVSRGQGGGGARAVRTQPKMERPGRSTVTAVTCLVRVSNSPSPLC